MRILFSDRHTYPFATPVGLGKAITNWPSGSPKYIHDLMVKALGEMGHQVFYLIDHAQGTIAPQGVYLINKFIDDVDLVHLSARHTPEVALYYQSKNIPVLATNHLYKPNEKPPFKWVHVSKTLADLYQEKQYVWIGLDPDDFIYATQKQDYFLFMADMSRAMDKGLDIALKLAKDKKLKLIVAGASSLQSDIDKVQKLCDQYKVSYVGDVRGVEKAKLLAGARALISPSKLQEASGTTLAEALFSGTPVICSNSGAQSEIISKQVGFVCNTEKEYHHAIDAIDSVDPKTCRTYAMNNFHFRNTTKQYVPIYEEMLKTVTR
jgi:glycosyltransferase involved in cell wall biosynthesis